jgi:hypothetical protein
MFHVEHWPPCGIHSGMFHVEQLPGNLSLELMFHVELWRALQVHNFKKLALRDSQIDPRGTYQAIMGLDESAIREKNRARLIRLKSPR